MSAVTVAWETTTTVPKKRSQRASAAAGARRSAQRRSFGLRFVAVSVVLACAVLAVLLILAAFHTRLAAGQYQLVELETAVDSEREALIDLQVELKNAESPAKLEVLAEGALGLVAAENPVSLVISPEHILSASHTIELVDARIGTDWLSLKELLSASTRALNH